VDAVVEFAIDPARFHEAFAADLPETQAAVLRPRNGPLPSLRSPSLAGPRLEAPSLLSRRRYGRQGGRHRRHPLDGEAGWYEDY
jgi:hypothetical protein